MGGDNPKWGSALSNLVVRIDRAQQRNRVLGPLFAVVKKFGDDRGSTLSALLTYYAFMSLFPLLLVFTTIVGFIGNDRIQGSLVGTALQQLPAFGQQIGPNAPHPLRGSLPVLAFGLIVLLYGTLGSAQSAQYAMAQVWNVPGVVRPGFFPRLARSLLLFVAVGVGVGLTAGVGAIATSSSRALSTRVWLSAGDLLLDVGLYFVVFRILTPRVVATRDLVAGAVFGGCRLRAPRQSGERHSRNIS